MKKLVYIICFLSVGVNCFAQKVKDTLYVNLSKIKYSKTESNRVGKAQVEHKIDVYSFTIPYAEAYEGSISFTGYHNFQFKPTYDSTKVITGKQVKCIKFIHFKKLVKFLKTHPSRNSYKLYFVEKQNQEDYKIYHVTFDNNFSREIE